MDQRCVWNLGALALAACLHCGAADGGVPQRPAAVSSTSALDIVLAPHEGTHALDERVRQQQARIARTQVRAAELERLGFLFVARARTLSDPGSYNLALKVAEAIEALEPGSHSALLLRGHALHSLHHFKEAELVARRLVQERGAPFDHGLLGDVLVDRGELQSAIDSYQRMMELRPDQHAYARAAHVRYLKGDLPGAIAAMKVAARAASPRNPESFAWTWAKLAGYQLQSGEVREARHSAERALEVAPESFQAQRAAALLALAEGDWRAALPPLKAAAVSGPHPEVLWMLSELLDRLAKPAEAAEARARLMTSGAKEDPRFFALYLASHGLELDDAERLARAELAERPDIYSYEALAWVQSAKGEHGPALENARRSLAEGTQDPRLYYHAGMIAQRAGDQRLARDWLARAQAAAGVLLPSQRAQLTTLRTPIGERSTTTRSVTRKQGAP